MSMNTATILVGNVLQRLKDIPDETVQSCITSPPYWGLRDYGHDGQLGLEATPEQYVENMVAVFREVWRVLKDDGVLWLNLGDSYVGYKGDNYLKNKSSSKLQSSTTVPSSHMVGTPQTSGLKSKDLVGIPWRVAFALQTDGWYLRQDIIWHKPNPMPESVTDRCTKAHEYLFMLTKSGRYYYDNEPIKEPCASANPESPSYRANGKSDSRKKHAIYCASCDGSGDQTDENGDDCYACNGTGLANISKAKTAVKNEGFWKPPESGRNKRSVWTIATKPFKGAHFAVMPEALCEPPILATSKPGDLVLDPFTGSGTTAVVALRHNRNFIGCELNPKYAAIAEKRISEDRPMMNTVKVNAA